MCQDLGVGQVELKAVAADGCQFAFALVVGVLRDLDGSVALDTELHGSGQCAITVDAAFFGKLVFLAHDQLAGELFGGVARGPGVRSLAGVGELAGQRQLGACKGLAFVVHLGDGKIGALVVEAHIYGLRMLLLGDAELHLFSAQDGAVDGLGFLEVVVALAQLIDCDDAFAIGCQVGLDGGAAAFAVQVEPDIAGERVVRAVDGLGQLHAAQDALVGESQLHAVLVNGSQVLAVDLHVLRDGDGAVVVHDEAHAAGQGAEPVGALGLAEGVGFADYHLGGDVLGSTAGSPGDGAFSIRPREASGQLQLGARNRLTLVVHLGELDIGRLVFEAAQVDVLLAVLGVDGEGLGVVVAADEGQEAQRVIALVEPVAFRRFDFGDGVVAPLQVGEGYLAV